MKDMWRALANVSTFDVAEKTENSEAWSCYWLAYWFGWLAADAQFVCRLTAGPLRQMDNRIRDGKTR